MSKKTVVKQIFPLVQRDFKALIVSDIAYEEKYDSLHKIRTAIFQCTKCHNYYENDVSTEKKKQTGWCRSCFEESKFRYTPLVQDSFKANIVYDTEYITKKRMKTREAIFRCDECALPFIETIDEALNNKYGKCKDCMEYHWLERLHKNNTSFTIIKNLGFQQSTKHVKNRYYLLLCNNCNKNFTAMAIRIKPEDTKCDLCILKEQRKTTYKKNLIEKGRLYYIWRSIFSRTSEKYKTSHPNSAYALYDVTICREWLDFETFQYWALNNKYNNTLSIDRKNNKGNYEPDNCRWTNKHVQSANTRRLRSTNTSGYRNVTWYKPRQKWRVQISIQNQRKTLGYFDNKIEAALYHDKYIDDNNLPHTKNF